MILRKTKKGTEDVKLDSEYVYDSNARISQAEFNQDALNLIPTGEASGSVIYIDDSSNFTVKSINAKGKSYQNTYTGKNLLDRPQHYSVTSNHHITSKVHITQTGSYIVQCGEVIKGGAKDPYIRLGNVGVSLASNTKATITLDSLPSPCYVYSNGYSAQASLDVTSTINDLMIYPASITDDTYEPFVGCKPSPSADYPQEMVSVSGNVVEETSNKNLFDMFDFVGSHVTFKTLNEKLIDLKADTTAGAQFAINYVKNVDATKTYTISFKAKKINFGQDSSSGTATVYMYGSNDGTNYTKISSADVVIGTVLNQEYSVSKELTGYANYRFYFYNVTGTTVPLNCETQYYDIQVEENSTATSFVEHKGKTVTLTLPEGMELKSIPETNYRDYFYKNENDGKWHYYQAVKKGIIYAANEITEYKGSYWVDFYKNEDSMMYGDFNTYRLLCECARYASVFNTPYSYQTSTSADKMGFIVKSTDTIEDIRPKINGKSYYYPLKEPIDTEITDSTLLAQLEELEKTQTYKNITHIITSSDGLAPDLEIVYYKDLNVILDNLNNAILSQGSNV